MQQGEEEKNEEERESVGWERREGVTWVEGEGLRGWGDVVAPGLVSASLDDDQSLQ